MTTANALSEMLDPLTDVLTVEAARTILAIEVPPNVQAKVHDLADRNNEGLLSEDERAEFDGYVTGADLISILKLKAKRFLKDRGLE